MRLSSVAVALSSLLGVSANAACSPDSSIDAASAGSGAAGSEAVGTAAGSGAAGAGAAGTGGHPAGVGGSGEAEGATVGSSASGAAGSGGAGCGWGGAGPSGWGGGGPDCSFPQGLPDEDYIESACSFEDTDPVVDAAVNLVMETLSGCGQLSDCDITGFPGTVEEVCQSWFDAVTGALRDQGYCAGLHVVGSTDEIAVSNTGCAGKWYGYHICNYGGPKVVWNPGARRGWWRIAPQYCP